MRCQSAAALFVYGGAFNNRRYIIDIYEYKNIFVKGLHLNYLLCGFVTNGKIKKEMRKNIAFDFLFIIIVYVVSVKIFSISMNEPFNTISFYDLVWQYIIPAIILTLCISFICFKFYVKSSSKNIILMAFLLFAPMVLSVEAIYGYSWDLYHHQGIK